MILLKQILSCIDGMLIGAGPEQRQNEHDSGIDSSFQNELNNITVEFDKATKESDSMNIFEANFLERKVLITLLTFKKVLEEAENVVCLVLTLIQKRLDVADYE